MTNQRSFNVKADVDLENELRGQQSLEKVMPALMRLDDKRLMQVHLDVEELAIRVLGCADKIKELQPQAARLDGFDASCMDQLEDLAVALTHAHIQYLISIRPDGDIKALNIEATQTRDRFRSHIESLIADGMLDTTVLRGLSKRKGYARVAADLGLLVVIFQTHWAELEHRICYTQADLDRAEGISSRMTRFAERRKRKSVEENKWLDLESRAFTLLVRSYDQARRAVVFLRWNHGDADKIAPSLYAARWKHKRKQTRQETVEARGEAVQNAPAPVPLAAISPNGPFVPVEPAEAPVGTVKRAPGDPFLH